MYRILFDFHADSKKLADLKICMLCCVMNLLFTLLNMNPKVLGLLNHSFPEKNMYFLEIWFEICHACSKPVAWKGPTVVDMAPIPAR